MFPGPRAAGAVVRQRELGVALGPQERHREVRPAVQRLLAAGLAGGSVLPPGRAARGPQQGAKEALPHAPGETMVRRFLV